jgi:hypothetical protein
LRVNARLLSVPQGTIVWSERMDVPVSDVIRVQDELSELIADSLAVPLTPREQRVLRRDATDAEVVFAGAWAPMVVAVQIPKIVATVKLRMCMMSSRLH